MDQEVLEPYQCQITYWLFANNIFFQIYQSENLTGFEGLSICLTTACGY